MKMSKSIFKLFIELLLLSTCSLASNITSVAFGGIKDALPAAYGDFNSDELTDIFVLTEGQKVVQILFLSNSLDANPLLRLGPQCKFEERITSVVPGDFDGDAFMDVLVTVHNSDHKVDVFVLYGDGEHLNCSGLPVIEEMMGEPLTLDFNHDMIIDLFGLDKDGNRKFWQFGNRTALKEIEMKEEGHRVGKIRIPHSHAILDLDGDFLADLVLSCDEGYEIWHGVLDDSEFGFKFNNTIKLPEHGYTYGQSIFTDFELKGKFDQIVPVCWDKACHNSSLMVSAVNEFKLLTIAMKDNHNTNWFFARPDRSDVYANTIPLRVGDFNLDGYPDLLVTLENYSGMKQTFLFQNIECERYCNGISRTFEVKWTALSPFGPGSVMGSFYDFYQDGTLDVILIEKYGETYRPFAFRNSLDYDANFVKVIVLTGLTNSRRPSTKTPLGRTKLYYGTNLPGPRIEFKTTNQDGAPQHGASPQLCQSAYFSLQLPYTVFGLGRTPNFVDSLTVGLAKQHKTWTQLIPNSQMIVVPSPLNKADFWKAQMFVTPSKLILMSVIALGGICIVILFIIIGLHYKEKRADKLEKLQQAHRFHFDAM